MTATLNMLADHLATQLSDGCAVATLRAGEARFRRCVLAGDALRAGEDDWAADGLFAGDAASCAALRAAFPKAPCLVVLAPHEEDRLFDGPGLEEGSRGKGTSGLLAIRTACSPLEALACAQSLLVEVGDWIGRMQAGLLDGGGYQELVESSEPIIGNPLVVSDAAFRIVAHTKGILPQEPGIALAIETGRFDSASMERFRQRGRSRAWEASKGVSVLDEATEERPYPIVSRVFRIQGHYFLHLVMHCDSRPLTPGLRDLLGHLVDQMERYLERTGEHALFGQGAPLALSRLAQGLAGSMGEAERQLGLAGIKAKDPLRMLAFDHGYGSDESSLLSYAALRLIDELPQGLVSLAEGRVIALVDVEPKAIEGALERYAERFGCAVGLSDAVEGVEGIRHAHLQAQAALRVGRRAGLPGRLYPFSSCFARLVALGEEGDRELVASCLARSVAARMAPDDRCLMEAYLRGERRTSRVAVQLHLHRTTLAYRIDRLCERFGLDLEDACVRERFLLEATLLALSEEESRG